MRYAVQSGIIRYNPALDMAGALTTVKRQHRPALDLSRLPELLSRIGGYKGQPVTQLAVMLNLLVLFVPVNSDTPAGLKLILTMPCGLFSRTRTSAGRKILTPGIKMRTPHLVPLSKQVVAILAELQTWAGENGLIFTGAHDPRKPISENTVNKALRVMGYDTTRMSVVMDSGRWHVVR